MFDSHSSLLNKFNWSTPSSVSVNLFSEAEHFNVWLGISQKHFVKVLAVQSLPVVIALFFVTKRIETFFLLCLNVTTGICLVYCCCTTQVVHFFCLCSF